jgi:hypothetical protein
MEKPKNSMTSNSPDFEYLFYEAQLKQSSTVSIPENLIPFIINKIKKNIADEGSCFQFAYNPSTQEKSVIATKDLKAFENAFIVNHISTFGINEIKNKIEKSENTANIFTTILSDKDPNSNLCLENERPKLPSLNHLNNLKKVLNNGKQIYFYNF